MCHGKSSKLGKYWAGGRERFQNHDTYRDKSVTKTDDNKSQDTGHWTELGEEVSLIGEVSPFLPLLISGD